MGLREDLNEIFKENSEYANPRQAANQASSLNTLSDDLYTESKRFIYELLQNADDSSVGGKPIQVWIKLMNENLIVAHTGKAFDTRDLQGICNVNNGTKKSDLTKTGYKGIGFKSVFGQSEKVTIFTNKEYFKFDASYPHLWKWDESQEVWEKKNHRKFELPWQIIPIYLNENEICREIGSFLNQIDANVATIIHLKNKTETIESIVELSQQLNMFLFLKNINKIHFDVSGLTTIEINRIENDKTILKKNNTVESVWLINTCSLIVPDDIKSILRNDKNLPDKLKNTENIELTLAAQVKNGAINKLRKH